MYIQQAHTNGVYFYHSTVTHIAHCFLTPTQLQTNPPPSLNDSPTKVPHKKNIYSRKSSNDYTQCKLITQIMKAAAANKR